MKLRPGAGVALATLTALACSTGQSSSPDGSVTGPADAFAQVTLSAGADGGACPGAGSAPWEIGTPASSLPVTVRNGASTATGAAVTVTCSVAAAGRGFDVSLKLASQGAQGAGTLVVSSPAGAGAVTPDGGSDVTATFQAASGAYAASGCTIGFTYQGHPVPDTPSVAAGRIWGHLSCPDSHLADAAGACDLEADFLFEGCAK